MQASCDGITWNGIETGSNKTKVKEPFFFLLVQYFPLSRRGRRTIVSVSVLSVFTTLIRSEDKGLLAFQCPVDLVSFALVLSS